jgi:hypothetical protein
MTLKKQPVKPEAIPGLFIKRFAPWERVPKEWEPYLFGRIKGLVERFDAERK